MLQICLLKRLSHKILITIELNERKENLTKKSGESVFLSVQSHDMFWIFYAVKINMCLKYEKCKKSPTKIQIQGIFIE